MAALRIVFLAVAAGIFGLLAWRGGAPGPSPVAAPPRRAAAPAEAMGGAPPLVAAALPAPRPTAPADPTGDVPEFASFYGRLRSDFPRDASAIPGRDGPAPSADAAIWDVLRDLEQTRGVLAAQAGAPALDRFFDARSAMLDGLAPVDARRCVDFLYGMTDAAMAGFTAGHRGLVASLADRTLDAIADGRERRLDRAAPTEADFDALTAGLSAFGLTPAEIGLLIDGTTPDPPLPDRRVCEIGRTYLDVLHGLPADARGRLYGLAAVLLARS